VEVQTSENGNFRPIGTNGFYHLGGTRSTFDEQPIEAYAMVLACLEAYRATLDSWWHEQAHRAFDWFLGWNDLGLELHSVHSGGCCDASQVDRVNGNQGAESILGFLLSLAEMRLMQDTVTVFNEPASEALMKPISLHRTKTTLYPDCTRVLVRPLQFMSGQRASEICARVMALPYGMSDDATTLPRRCSTKYWRQRNGPIPVENLVDAVIIEVMGERC